jgi:hypothetical protein
MLQRPVQGYGSNAVDATPVPQQLSGAATIQRINEMSASTTASVVRINNGFLVTQFIYNPSGPDSFSTTYAATLEDLAQVLVSTFAAQRLKT